MWPEIPVGLPIDIRQSLKPAGHYKSTSIPPSYLHLRQRYRSAAFQGHINKQRFSTSRFFSSMRISKVDSIS
jgi:hypothetical protein